MTFRACLTALTAALFLAAASASMAAPDPAAPVAVQAGDGVTTAMYDFGDVSQADHPQISHAFVLRNSGTRPLTIERLQPSCECTSASLVPEAVLPQTLAPGGQISVRVSVVVEPYFNGPLRQFAQVYVDGQDAAAAMLTLTATMHPLVITDPMTLDFGAGPAGAARSRTVTATIDDRLAPAQGAPVLAATDPDLQITPLASPPPASPHTRTYAYRVTLAANAALGPVSDLLQFARVPGAASVDGMALSDGPGIEVTGTVNGDATATPQAVAFGVVTEGHASARPIRIDAVRGDLSSAQAVAASPLVRLGWGRAGAGSRVLNVTLASTAPAGPVQSTVTVTLASGQRLRLPVTAYVSGP